MIYQDYVNSANYIKEKIEAAGKSLPSAAIILGSGLSDFAERLQSPVIIDYNDIPNFAPSGVSSHKGKAYIGETSGKTVFCMAGRSHYYEGYDMQRITVPIRVMKLLGIKSLIITNAAGGINTQFTPGDLMLITDHIKLCDNSPVRGENGKIIEEFGERFFDMSNAYDKQYQKIAVRVSRKLQIKLQSGVYAYMAGPQFETPAEIRALRILGADAVGMSSVAEAISAAQCGIRTLGISCISNMAAGISGAPISDSEVCEVAGARMEDFINLVCAVIKEIS